MNLKQKICLLLPLAAFILAWQFLSGSGLVNSSLFPPPTKVLASFIELWNSGELLLHIRSSIFRVFTGLIIGSIVGIFFGLMTGRIKIVDKSISPILQVIRSFPPVAIIPLVIAWIGIGESAKIFSISFAVFFPVWINTHIGASNVPSGYLRAASTLTNSALKRFSKVILPASLPLIIAGIRTGISIVACF